MTFVDAQVLESEADRASLVGSTFDRPDYEDRFCIDVRPGQYRVVDEVATDWFDKQPALLRLLSTNSISRKGVEAATRDGGYAVGSAVGSWKVYQRDDNEIVFGDNMGFMEYRFSLRLADPPVAVEGATAVKFLWRRSGKFYFAIVRPLHRRFIKYLLIKATSAE